MTWSVAVDCKIAAVPERTAAYVSGLFDCCGTVSLTTRESRPHSYRLEVSLYHENKVLLGRVRKTLGAGSLQRNKDGHRLSLGVDEAAPFLRMLWGHVIVKREHVRAALEYLDGYEPCRGSTPIEREQVEHRRRYYFRLKELNAP